LLRLEKEKVALAVDEVDAVAVVIAKVVAVVDVDAEIREIRMSGSL
jgi:hypothetical protein